MARTTLIGILNWQHLIDTGPDRQVTFSTSQIVPRLLQLMRIKILLKEILNFSETDFFRDF